MPDAPASSRRCTCSTATLFSPAGDIVVLRVAGEVDLDNFAVLDAALDDVLERRPDHLIVDLTGLVICSSRGITAIARTAQVAIADGTRYSMSGASPMLARLWPHYWPDGDAPPIHRTTAAAVLSAIVLQADQWKPVPTAPEQARPVADEHHPDSRPVNLLDDHTDPPSPTDRHHPRPDVHDADPSALRQALHRHRSKVYRSALHALGAPYKAHPLAPDLDAQLRTALAGFAATPPDNHSNGRPGWPSADTP
ncbi:STAS domain-containing protein [Pseudonocardia charpentierae]|uniref:STAS domain-containing protein n=1 Tax=Pseudonocardia charpentierae TaxID=3075545 RepID=A0ABU2NEE6_9PSEU|nr:STAS domain-containing protein [Pseudonocardia sp. DSM 45834]MDT0351629.1 STAS domain-containing protein [Pseudonocardia sp. DSM 45834]